jgi:hypothetical protein
MFSGWLSLNPGEYFAGRNTARETLQRYAGHDAPNIATKLPTRPSAMVEARFVWLDGTPLMIAASRDGSLRPLDMTSGELAALPPDRLWTAATKLLPQARIVERLILSEYDAYWYAHHHDRELPVLRAVFDDEAKTWFHISLVTGDIVGRVDNSRRTYRWLFNALHSFDFQLLLKYRPAWDILVWLLSILGTIVSMSGVVIGWRYLRG